MSHAAAAYVKHLLTAPNGDRITAAEKVVLGLLADDHREEVGIAWSKVGTLARLAGVHPRNCRKILASLEKKGIIQRVATVREKDGGQSSNEYMFVQLDVPEKYRHYIEENLKKLQKVPRVRLPGGGGRKRQGEGGESALPPRAKSPHRGGSKRPPIDPSFDPSLTLFTEPSSEENPPTPQGGVSSLASHFTAFGEFKLLLKSEMASIPGNLASSKVFSEIRRGANDYDTCFRDWWLVDVQRRPGGWLLITEANDTGATEAGITKYETRLTRNLRKYFHFAPRETVTFSIRKTSARKSA